MRLSFRSGRTGFKGWLVVTLRLECHGLTVYVLTAIDEYHCLGSNCWLSDLRQEGFQFFNFTFGDHEGHIGGVAQLFTFGTQYNETYIGGNETVS